MNTSGAGGPLIDWNQFDSVIPRPDSPCIAVFQRFREGFGEEVGKVRSAWEVDNKELARFLLHQLRGASGSFGLADLANRIWEVEEKFRDGVQVSRKEITDWVGEVTRSLGLSCREIRAHRGIGGVCADDAFHP